jgi:transposase
MSQILCYLGDELMMGRQSPPQSKLFYTTVSLDKRVRKDHPLRKIAQMVDFDFIYHAVEDRYGVNGNVSVAPPVILKLMLLLILYNVRSERELMLTIPERLDWLWFLGYDLDDEIPNHSVLSKARSRWGVAAFRRFFEHIVRQCVEVGLVDGTKLFIDASLIDADASNNSVVDTHDLKRYLREGYHQLEGRLDDVGSKKATPVNSRHISSSDPDASVTRHGGGEPRLRYKTHRAVDPHSEVITATTITPGSRDEGELLSAMVELHERNTHRELQTAVADSKYGKIGNFLWCHELGIRLHAPSIEVTHRGSGRQKGIFPKEVFEYDPQTDTFTCPAGQLLRRRMYNKRRKTYEYQASAEICASCYLKDRCTRSKTGRTLKRHERQDALDTMLRVAASRQAKRDIKTRQHLAERSFAWSTRYGYKRARWRRLWRMQIQDFLVAAVQNITILINHSTDRLSKSNAQRGQQRTFQRITNAFSCFRYAIMMLGEKSLCIFTPCKS